MIGWILTFLVLAAIAALFGFGGIVEAAVSIAMVLFWIFVALLVVSLIFEGVRHIGHSPHA